MTTVGPQRVCYNCLGRRAGMLASLAWVVLVQGLTLLQLDPAHSASPLGAVVHVVPIETSNGTKTVSTLCFSYF